jgi:DNA-binding transcriptional LysR family regulator
MNPPFTSERDAEVFLAVVDRGGITAAAAVLRIAQPSLSQAIRALETRAGVPLFDRTPRGAVPTADGQVLIGAARRILAAGVAARAAVHEVVEMRAGVLHVVAHASVTAFPLAAAVGAFRRAHPGVLVRVADVTDDDELVSTLVQGHAELAVVSLPLPAGSLVVDELGAHDIVAVFPPGSPHAGEPLHLSELRDIPLIAVQHGGSARRAVRAAVTGAAVPDRADAVAGRAAVVTPRLGTVVPLVLAGAGAALVDRWYAGRIADLGGVVRPVEPALRAPFGVTYRAASLSPAAATFVRALRDVCAD